MKKRLVYLLGLGTVILSCSREPQSCITVDRSEIKVGETITAINCGMEKQASKFWLSYRTPNIEMEEGAIVPDSVAQVVGKLPSICESTDEITFVFSKPGKYLIVNRAELFDGKCDNRTGPTIVDHSFVEIEVE